MIALMCHGITLHPCWLHVCQGTKLKYTCQHIDTGSGVGRWPSTDLCHRPRVGEYCASIGMPPPFRSAWRTPCRHLEPVTSTATKSRWRILCKHCHASTLCLIVQDLVEYVYHVAGPWWCSLQLHRFWVFGQIMIVLMCHSITLYPCWLHVCQGTKLKYTCQHIDTGSCVGRWPSTGLCHRPRVGEYCASIGMPPPFRSGYYGH